MDSVELADKKAALEEYDLQECQLVIKQGTQLDEILEAEQDEMDQLNVAHAQEMNAMDSMIASLNQELLQNHRRFYSANQLLEEIDVFYPNIKAFSVSDGIIYNTEDSIPKSTKLVFIDYEDKLYQKDLDKIELWLKERLETDNIKIVQE